MGFGSQQFMNMSWAAVSFMVLTAIPQLFEWRFELWTPKGRRIVLYKKPADESWLSWSKRVTPLPPEEADPLLEDADDSEIWKGLVMGFSVALFVTIVRTLISGA